MKGYSLIIPAGANPVETDMAMRASKLEYDRKITYDELREAVNGDVQLVPEFSCMRVDGEDVTIVAYCNENARFEGAAQNVGATYIYERALQIERNDPTLTLDPQWRLVGPIMVVWGDDEFMSEL